MNPIIKEMQPQRYGTKGSIQVAISSLDSIAAVVYLSEGAAGNVFYAKAFTRKALNPQINHYFHSKEKREAMIGRWIANHESNEQAKIDARAKKKAATHDLVVGSILNTSWGYDQTNVSFYQVVGIKSKTMVFIREIAQIQHDGSHVLPARDKFVGEKMAKRVHSEYSSIKIHGSATAHLTSEAPMKEGTYGFRPSYCTPFGMGH